MTIELLSADEYNRLLEIQRDYPKLTFQNAGYQYIDTNTLSAEDKQADKEVETILRKRIHRFVLFDNFLLVKNGELTARFHYYYSDNSIRVGYITLRELFYGFDEPDAIEDTKKEVL